MAPRKRSTESKPVEFVGEASEPVFDFEKLEKARLAVDLLKTLVVAHAARTGAGLNEETLKAQARLARLAVAEVWQ